MIRGARIAYAERDGIPVCILDDGTWCEREAGHPPPHVIAPYIPSHLWAAGVNTEVNDSGN